VDFDFSDEICYTGNMAIPSTSKQLTAILNNNRLPIAQRVVAGDSLRYALVRDGEDTAAEKMADRVIALGSTALADRAVYDAVERAYITKAPNDFHAYLIALEWNRAAKSRFYQPRIAVLRPVVDVLTDMMVRDLYDIVMLSSPPRIGKSSLGLLFISWLVGRNSADPILMTSYAEKITKMFHDGLTEIYNDSEYNYRAIFPLVQLVNTSAKDLTLDFRDDGKTDTRKYKSVTCRAIDGSLTGATEARQLLYCDDLVRDIEEALSLSRLQMLKDKLITNVYSRKKEGCKELHIGTRWSLHDPLGWVERQHADDPRCKVIILPALDEDEQSNFDYPYGVGFSTNYYKTLRDETYRNDQVTWGCVYQQKPVEREGLLFPAEDLTYVLELPDIIEHPPSDIFAFCDVAFGGDDFLSMPVAYQWGDDPPIIADVVFLKGDYKITEPLVAGKLVQMRVARAVFEANNGGDFYSRDVAGLVKDIGHPIYLTATRAASNKSKETRIIQHSPAIKAFAFLDPRSELASPMYRTFLSQLTTYTMSGTNEHDDAPDSLAGLASMLRMNLNATLTVYDRKHI
jgi:predicted phage terminase large subunit-like protein